MFNPKLDELITRLPFAFGDYKFQSLLGRGDYACTFKVQQISTNYNFAARVINCEPNEEKKVSLIRQEIICLMGLMHTNIARIFERFRMGNFLVLLLELCEKGSLAGFVSRRSNMSADKMVIIMKQLLKTLSYCHSQGFAHRNIKMSNILVTNAGIVKLTDFRIGTRLNSNNYPKSLSSFMYKAPEQIKKEESSPFKTDVWSLGVVFYYIATGGLSWGTSKETIERNILSGNFRIPEEVPILISNLIKRMLVVDPEKRASVDELLKDPCFTLLKAFSTKQIHNKNIKMLPCLNKPKRKLIYVKEEKKQKAKSRELLPLLKDYNRIYCNDLAM